MSLYLRSSRAKYRYTCAQCSAYIPKGQPYFRGDGFPVGRGREREKAKQFCVECVGARHNIIFKNPPRTDEGRTLFDFLQEEIHPTIVTYSDVTSQLIAQLKLDWNLIYQINEDRLEELVMDRLIAMGFFAQRTGKVNRKDGGIDVLFWSQTGIPILGAAQVKHHASAGTKSGPDIVRDMAGVMKYQPFNVGVLVTNTSFTADATWVANQLPSLLRLRDGEDIRRWVEDNFTDEAEYRELPMRIELCPGVIVDVPILKPSTLGS